MAKTMHPERPLEFRLAAVEDAGLVRDLVRAAYAKWIPLIGREPMPMIVDYETALQEQAEGHRVDLACIGPKVTGLIETYLYDDHLWIENLAVWPDEQGKGLGRCLLLHAESRARASGRAEMRLLTNEAFETNVAFYQRAGYTVARREPFMGGTTVHLSRELSELRNSF